MSDELIQKGDEYKEISFSFVNGGKTIIPTIWTITKININNATITLENKKLDEENTISTISITFKELNELWIRVSDFLKELEEL